MTGGEKLAGGIDSFIDVVGRITAWSSFALAIVMGSNGLLRYGFSYGSIGAQELEWQLLSPVRLVVMSCALRHGEHVRVDVLYDSFSPKTKALVNLLAAVLAMVLSLLVIYLSWSYVAQSWSMNEDSAN